MRIREKENRMMTHLHKLQTYKYLHDAVHRYQTKELQGPLVAKAKARAKLRCQEEKRAINHKAPNKRSGACSGPVTGRGAAPSLVASTTGSSNMNTGCGKDNNEHLSLKEIEDKEGEKKISDNCEECQVQ